jgi:D-cysteine desulfhydrase
VALGVEVHPAGGAQVPRALWRLWRRGDFLLPLGGSSAESLAGHMDAAEELAQAVEGKALPLPDVVVVALASGGTAVGLAAGLARRRLPVQVLAVCATHRSAGARVFVWNQLAKLAGKWPGWVAGAAGRLRLEPRFLGAGYSLPTAESERAHQLGQVEGLTLDPAYTAKAFAASLALVQRAQVRNVLFWQTHASTSLEPLLREAPDEASLPRALRALLLPLEGPCASS